MDSHGACGRLKYHDYCENDELFFEDIRRVAELLGRNYVSGPEYDKQGKYCRRERAKKYEGWNGTLIAAGLEQTPFRTGPKRTYSNEELFEEMERVWINQDLDGDDQQAIHLWLTVEGRTVAYLRHVTTKLISLIPGSKYVIG